MTQLPRLFEMYFLSFVLRTAYALLTWDASKFQLLRSFPTSDNWYNPYRMSAINLTLKSLANCHFMITWVIVNSLHGKTLAYVVNYPV